jgi:hypothetical protein
MESSHLHPILTSVRLFPRLAVKPSATVQAVRRRAANARRNEAVSPRTTGRPTQDEVRVRLLKMIVENERTRRQEPHAS